MKRLKMVNLLNSDVDYSQSFSNFQAQYMLDSKTNKLVQIEDKDCQELIQSSADCALDKILEKFGYEGLFINLPKAIDTDDVLDGGQNIDVLQEMGESIDIANNWRDKLGLSYDLTTEQVFEFMNNNKEKLKAFINQKIEANKIEGGIANEEKKTDEESK